MKHSFNFRFSKVYIRALLESLVDLDPFSTAFLLVVNQFAKDEEKCNPQQQRRKIICLLGTYWKRPHYQAGKIVPLAIESIMRV